MMMSLLDLRRIELLLNASGHNVQSRHLQHRHVVAGCTPWTPVGQETPLPGEGRVLPVFDIHFWIRDLQPVALVPENQPLLRPRQRRIAVRRQDRGLIAGVRIFRQAPQQLIVKCLHR